MAEVEAVQNSNEEEKNGALQVFWESNTTYGNPKRKLQQRGSPTAAQEVGQDAVSDCIKNTDSLCMARAVVVRKAVAVGEENWHKRLIRAEGLQTRRAKKPIKGAALKEREFTFEGVSAFERVSEQSIYFVLMGCFCQVYWVFKWLWYWQSMYVPLFIRELSMVTYNPAASKSSLRCVKVPSCFFIGSYWCHACPKGYEKKTDQRCDLICLACLRFDCERNADEIWCSDCFRVFDGLSWFSHHKVLPKTGARVSRHTIYSTIIICQKCQCMVYSFNVQGEIHTNVGKFFASPVRFMLCRVTTSVACNPMLSMSGRKKESGSIFIILWYWDTCEQTRSTDSEFIGEKLISLLKEDMKLRKCSP